MILILHGEFFFFAIMKKIFDILLRTSSGSSKQYRKVLKYKHAQRERERNILYG
jgi:hypothetical protein